ncbi:hypothetical protein KP509_39G048900 [Ceratopteris richardii]|uniref:Folate-biopterin transporter 4 n=1 Tax=Ceratopteris richardii TaxID=49495 RepID=A0A8T2Q130_CERRI|nr:hypothetical protein KP509_39G048900 [Ceratopteris richardii]
MLIAESTTANLCDPVRCVPDKKAPSIMQLISRLRGSFGAPFLFLVSSIYWTQGFRSLPWMAISYQFKDGLKLSPSASQSAMTVAFMPWSMKPLYGVMSDCIPIRGSRRISYLMISGILSYVPWLLLGLFESLRTSTVYMIGLLTLQNVGTAMADVVIDAMIAEAARKERAGYIGDLQSMSWFFMALGGMFGSILGGFALSTIDVKGIFLAFTFFPLLQLVSCSLVDEKALISDMVENDHEIELAEGNELQNKREGEEVVNDPNAENRCDCDPQCKDMSQNFEGSSESEGTEATQPAQEFEYGMLVQEDGDWVEVQANHTKDSASGHVSSENMMAVISNLESNVHLKKLNLSSEGQLKKRRVRRDFNQIEGAVVDVRKDTNLSVTSRLKETVVVLIQTIKQPSIRQPMLWFFLAQVMVPSLSTIMFYYQTDHLLLDASFLGTTRLVGWGALMLGTFIYNQCLKAMQLRKIFWFMPFLVLSARLCEPGIEGTLFALFMSMNNLGSTLSSFFGAGLASVLHISAHHFENLSLGICIQALCTVLPIFLLRWIPEGTGIAVEKSD